MLILTNFYKTSSVVEGTPQLPETSPLTQMTKFTIILAATVFAFSFAPAGMAVCNNGEIAIGHTSDVSHVFDSLP